MKEAHPLLNTITTKLYVKSTQTSKYGLDYYGWSYYMTRDTRHDGSWNKYLNYLGRRKLKELIARECPDAIISTFPFGSAPELGRAAAIPTFSGPRGAAASAEAIHFVRAPGWLPRGRRIYAIGDIHGCRAQLERLHA